MREARRRLGGMLLLAVAAVPAGWALLGGEAGSGPGGGEGPPPAGPGRQEGAGPRPLADPAAGGAAPGEAGQTAGTGAKQGDSQQRVAVELQGGDRLEGTLLKRDANRLFLFVGGQVVLVEQEKLKTLKTLGGLGGPREDLSEKKSFKLYQTANLPLRSMQALVEELGPAVVVVKTPAGLGTGWFCNSEGYLITNHHVIAGETSINITMFQRQGQEFGKKVYKKVRIVALSEELDLALLKIEEPIEGGYAQLFLGDSSDLKVGDTAFVIGNPLGLERSTSKGIISKTSRNMAGRLYLQTTAQIAPGNSGGPIFNERGMVVGVVNMGYVMLDGLGFAIPVKYVKEFLDNVESFAYDQDNPNTGMRYLETPLSASDGSLRFTAHEFIKAGPGISNLTLADLDGDGAQEAIFVNNGKSEIDLLRARKKDRLVPRPAARSGEAEEINRLGESDRFVLEPLPVRSRIFALAAGDLSGDGRPDLAFLGDVDGLAVLEQRQDGSFAPARKIESVPFAPRQDALRICDLEGDGKPDLFVLCPDQFLLFRDGSRRESFPLNASYQDRISRCEFADLNGDGRKDLIFFVNDRYFGVQVRFQNPQGQFIEEAPLRVQLSGPIQPFRQGTPNAFATLDHGLNRMREISLRCDPARPPGADGTQTTLRSLPVDPSAALNKSIELGDIDGDRCQEILAVDQKRVEFVVFSRIGGGFVPRRSPAPQGITQFQVAGLGGKEPVVVCYASTEKMLGVSRIENGAIAYPRPVNTAGQVQWIKVAAFPEDSASLIWVEALEKGKFCLRYAPVALLQQGAWDGQKGSLDLTSQTLGFGAPGSEPKAELDKKPADLAFADFNGDGRKDLVVSWSYTGKESLYLNLGENRFQEVLREQSGLEEKKGLPLLVADIDGDGRADVLQAEPGSATSLGFIRVLRLDAKHKLYVERQFNWDLGQISHLAFYERTPQGPSFLIVSGSQALVVRLDTARGVFEPIQKHDLSGLEITGVRVGDLDGDGRPDGLFFGKGVLQLLLHQPNPVQESGKVIFNARGDTFQYWNFLAADLTGDKQDEILLFDSNRSMLELHRRGPDGSLELLLRQRLYTRTIRQTRDSETIELPQEVLVGDLDGNGKADLLCILQDRLGIYLQDARNP